MEISKFIKVLKKNYKSLSLGSFIGITIFIGLFFSLPKYYLAEGTIFVYPVNKSSQSSEVSNELNYARNIIAISNSPEFKDLIAKKSLIKSSFSPLIGITGNVKLKEISPNILNLSVVADNEAEGNKIYRDYFLVLKDFSIKLNKGNSVFEMDLLAESPILNGISNSLYLFLVLGFLCGLFFTSFYFYFKERK